MDPKELHGNTSEQQMAHWIANLMMQRGFSFGLNSRIDISQSELADYFLSQGVSASRDELVERIQAAVIANLDLFQAERAEDGEVYWAGKRDLVDLLQPIMQVVKPLPTPRPPKKLASEAVAAPRPEMPPAQVELETPPPPAGQRHTEVSQQVVEEQVIEEMAESDEPAKIEEELPVTLQYKLAILQALYKMGGAGKAAEVVRMIPTLMKLPEDHRGTYARGPEGKSEEPKYVKYVHSARRFLIQDGELENRARGIWSVTDRGLDRLRKAGLAG